MSIGGNEPRDEPRARVLLLGLQEAAVVRRDRVVPQVHRRRERARGARTMHPGDLHHRVVLLGCHVTDGLRQPPLLNLKSVHEGRSEALKLEKVVAREHEELTWRGGDGAVRAACVGGDGGAEEHLFAHPRTLRREEEGKGDWQRWDARA